jgi:hypothetical protein
MQTRSWSSWVVALLVLSCSTTAFATGFVEANLTPASDESAHDIDVGTRLMATSDVKLRDVSLSKGARVVVRRLEEKRGRVASVDVELADGQVLKRIDSGTIRKSFVVSSD